MKRLANLRIPVLAACALAAGTAVGCLLLYFNIGLLWITAVIPFTAVIIILSAIFTKNMKSAALAAAMALTFAAGALGCFLRLDGYGEQLNEGQAYGFSATVAERNGDYLILKDVTADGEKINGKISATLNDLYGDYCDVGYKVKFIASVKRCPLFEYGKINYDVRENIRYRCTLSGGLKAEYSFSLFGSVKSEVRKALYSSLDKDSADIAYAMLTGDTYGMDGETLSGFRYGGVAHIFAVSGLHIGIVYGILNLITKKLKVRAGIAAAACIATVFLYAGICGFTVSSVRAAIMCTVAALSRLRLKKYDGMNALAASVLVILLISPASLFLVGFRLTVCAVTGIMLLSKKICRALKPLPRRLRETLGVSLAAQAGTAPVMLVSFGYLSGAGLLLNVIILPVLSAGFVLLFTGTLLSLVIPFSAALIIPICSLPVSAAASFIIGAGLENSLISGFGAGLFAPMYLAVLLLLSDKLNLKRLLRFTAAAIAAITAVGYSLINTLMPFGGYEVIASAYYGGGQVLLKGRRGSVLIVTEGLNPARISIMLNEYYAASPEAVILLGGEGCALYYVKCGLDCRQVYVYGGYIPVQPYNGITVSYENTFTVCGISFLFEGGKCVIAEIDGATVAVSAEDYVYDGDCGLALADRCSGASEYAVAFNDTNAAFNVYRDGDFKFTIKNGKIY